MFITIVHEKTLQKYRLKESKPPKYSSKIWSFSKTTVEQEDATILYRNKIIKNDKCYISINNVWYAFYPINFSPTDKDEYRILGSFRGIVNETAGEISDLITNVIQKWDAGSGPHYIVKDGVEVETEENHNKRVLEEVTNRLYFLLDYVKDRKNKVEEDYNNVNRTRRQGKDI